MANRRELLQSGLVVSALAALPPAIAQVAPGAVAVGTLATDLNGEDDRAMRAAALFVYDERSRHAVAAARDARDRNGGLHIASSTEVLTHLWYDELDARWRREPMTFAGVTTERTLFVLETLALDRGMRVVQRTAPGALPANSSLVRWVIAPKSVAKTLNRDTSASPGQEQPEQGA